MKRSEALVHLSRDHHRALSFSLKFENILKESEANAVLFWNNWRQEFSGHLAEHFTEEEERLFPLLHSLGEIHAIERLKREHKQMLLLLQAENAIAASKFAGLLREHVRYEERDLFNLLQQQIDEPVLLQAMI